MSLKTRSAGGQNNTVW